MMNLPIKNLTSNYLYFFISFHLAISLSVIILGLIGLYDYFQKLCTPGLIFGNICETSTSTILIVLIVGLMLFAVTAFIWDNLLKGKIYVKILNVFFFLFKYLCFGIHNRGGLFYLSCLYLFYYSLETY